MEPRGQMLWASNAAVAGRSQRAEGMEETKPQLSLGTSWGWEQRPKAALPSSDRRGPCRQSGRQSRVREARLLAGIMGLCDSCSLCGPHGPTACLPRSFQGHFREGRAARGYSEDFFGFVGLRASMKDGAEPHPMSSVQRARGNSKTSLGKGDHFWSYHSIHLWQAFRS